MLVLWSAGWGCVEKCPRSSDRPGHMRVSLVFACGLILEGQYEWSSVGILGMEILHLDALWDLFGLSSWTHWLLTRQ